MKYTREETKYLEIAIQTVLFNYKSRLGELVYNCDADLIKQMSNDITQKAIIFQNITDQAMKELELERD